MEAVRPRLFAKVLYANDASGVCRDLEMISWNQVSLLVGYIEVSPRNGTVEKIRGLSHPGAS